MMKKLLFSLLAVLTTTGAFAHEEGEYVFTGSQRFKTDTSNLLTNGDFSDGTNGWTDKALNPLDAEAWSTVQAGGPNGENALQSMGADLGGVMCQTCQVTPGTTYALSFYIKGDAAGSATNTLAFINMDGTLDKGTNSIETPVIDVMSTATYKDEWTEVTAVFTPNDSLAEKAGTTTLVISFGPLATNVSVANISVNEVHEVFDTRIAQLKIDYARMLMADPNFNSADASTLQGDIEMIEEALNTEAFDDIDGATEFVNQLATDIEAYLDVTSINVNSTEGNLIPGLNFADLSNWGRGGQYSASYLLNLGGGNWGHLATEPDVLRSAIQTGYNHSATFEAYNNDFPAGKYFFTAEIRNANTTKTSWPTVPTFNLEKKAQFYIGDNTFPMVTISGEQFQRFYFIADIPEGGFKAGVKWPFDVDTEEAQTVSGGAFFIRNAQVRSFNHDLNTTVLHVQAFKTFKAQWDAATDSRLNVLTKQVDPNYPWGKDSLQRAVDKWNPIYTAQQAKNWITEDGEDTGVASTDELLDWADYQGVEEYTTNAETGEQTRNKFALVRGFQYANNYVVSLNKPFTDLADAIVAAKALRNQGANLTGDREAYKTAILAALASLNQIRSNTTDATMEADTQSLAAAMSALDAATQAFLASVSEKPVVDIDFSKAFEEIDGGYKITGASGEMVFGTNVSTDTTVEMDNWNWGLGYNGENTEVLHVGGAGYGTAAFEAPTDNEAVTITFDMWYGNLSGAFIGVDLLNAAGEIVAGFSMNRYNGTLGYNDFNDEANTGLDILKYVSGLGSSSVGNNGIYADNNKSSFTLIVDYKNNTLQGKVVNGKNGTCEGKPVALPTPESGDNKIVSFNVGNNGLKHYGAAALKNYQAANGGAHARRCWFDNLRISKYQLTDVAEDITENPWLPVGEIDGIQSVNNVKVSPAAIYTINGVQVKSATKPGLYIQNGKKFVVK